MFALALSVCAALLIGDAACQDVPDNVDLGVLIKFRTWELRSLCPPSGPTACTCIHDPKQNITGPFDDSVDSFQALYNFVLCNPGFCECPGKREMVDARPPPLKAVLDVCPNGRIKRCLCENKKDKLKERANEDFTMIDFINCKPTRCKCHGSNKVQVVTKMGCDEGGFAECPTPYESYCSDGTHLTANFLMEWQMANNATGCPCPDGVHSKCKETGTYPQCPNGDYINEQTIIIPNYKHCKVV